MNSRVLSEKPKSVEFKSLKFFLTLLPVQSFLLEIHYRMSFFLLRRWHDSIFSSHVSAPICCKTLHIVFERSLCATELGMSFIRTHSLRKYYVFLQHWRSRKATCLTRASFTFLQTSISDSILLKLSFKFLTPSVNLDIVC